MTYCFKENFKIVKEALDINDGHHFFISTDGRLVIADHSIDGYKILSPESSEDGVLYVDFSRPLKKYNKDSYYMPLLDRDGRKTYTISSAKDAIFAQTKMQKLFAITD